MFDGAAIAGVEDGWVLQGNGEGWTDLPLVGRRFVERPEHVARGEWVIRYVSDLSTHANLGARRRELDWNRALRRLGWMGGEVCGRTKKDVGLVTRGFYIRETR